MLGPAAERAAGGLAGAGEGSAHGLCALPAAALEAGGAAHDEGGHAERLHPDDEGVDAMT